MLEGTAWVGSVVTLITLVIGIVLLILGRKLFWLLVGVLGFLIGLMVATQWLQEQPDWIIIVAAFACGIIGALLAVIGQKIAVTVAGFVMGGYALIWLLQLVSLDLGQWQWLPFIVGGVIGAILAVSLFDMALIILSATVGAILIVQLPNFNAVVTALLFVALIAVGIAVQFKNWQQE